MQLPPEFATLPVLYQRTFKRTQDPIRPTMANPEGNRIFVERGT